MGYEMLTMRFEQDETYTENGSLCYFDRETGDAFWHYATLEESEDNMGSACSEEWRRNNLKLCADPERYILVPSTSHGEWHNVFFDWLRENTNQPGLIPSIGAILKEMTDEERYEWQNYKSEYAGKKAEKFISENRLK